MNNNFFNVALYVRLSREDGDNLESESIINQKELLHTFLNKNKDKFLLIDEYVDDGFTGSNFERPAWKRLWKDIKKGKVNTIITKDLSRMGRDYISMGEYIERVFPEKNIRYIAINDDIDTLYETPGLEFLQFKLMFNDYFLKDTSKKIRKIVRSKKENGQFLGWKAPYGYMKDPNDKYKLIVDENVRGVVERIFNLALEGNGTKKIAHILSSEHIPTPSMYANLGNNTLWCPRTIEAILTNETYIGNLTQGRRKKINYKSKKEIRLPKNKWIIKKNTHEAIIKKDVFETVGSLLKKNKNKKVKNNIQLLSGFMICAECGHSIGINVSKDGKRKYCHCCYYTANSKYGLCTPHSLNYDKLEKSVLEEIRNLSLKYVDSSTFEDKVKKTMKERNVKVIKQKELDNLNKKIKEYNLYMDKMYEDKLKENIDSKMFKRIFLKYKSEVEIIKQKIGLLKKEIDAFDKKNNPEDVSTKIKRYVSLANPDRGMLVNLIDKIVISEDKIVKIYYKFKV